MTVRFFSSLIALFILCSAPCYADSWAPPQPEIFVSANKTYRVRIAPRPIKSALAFFSDKLEHREPAGAARGQKQASASATVQHLGADGKWTTLWSDPLTNEVAPVSALISDDGQYLVTFDNWHSMGYGPNVVAIHDGRGQLIRALALNALVSDDYVFALPHSVSSIQWRDEPRLGPNDTVIIPIIVPGEQRSGEAEATIDAVLRLSDGELLSANSPEWKNAEAAAVREAQAKRDIDTRNKQAFIAPLLGATDNTEQAWHQYLVEAYFRSAPRWKEDYPSTTVLRDPSAPDYAASEGWMRDAILSLDYPHGAMAFASIAPFEHFVARTKSILAEAKSGALKGSVVFIAAPTETLPLFQAMFARTGAEVHVFDPKIPIPQRPERMKRYLNDK